MGGSTTVGWARAGKGVDETDEKPEGYAKNEGLGLEVLPPQLHDPNLHPRHPDRVQWYDETVQPQTTAAESLTQVEGRIPDVEYALR